MSVCDICPRACATDRSVKKGWCGAGDTPYIARAALHEWEEPYISGRRGSGAIFFAGCNMRCLFCQNYEISRGGLEGDSDCARIADIMLKLQNMGAHNINLVTPTPHLKTLIPALEKAKTDGLRIPVVYNTNAYEKTESLKRLEGLVDIYLPDLKYVTPAIAKRYSECENYFSFAAPAIGEMYRQCGQLVLDAEGLASKGTAIRHLVLPGAVPETRRVLEFIRGNYPDTMYISLMAQYVPCYKADFPPLNRRLLKREYNRAVEYCDSLGFKNVLIQELSSADTCFTPPFDGSIC